MFDTFLFCLFHPMNFVVEEVLFLVKNRKWWLRLPGMNTHSEPQPHWTQMTKEICMAQIFFFSPALDLESLWWLQCSGVGWLSSCPALNQRASPAYWFTSPCWINFTELVLCIPVTLFISNWMGTFTQRKTVSHHCQYWENQVELSEATSQPNL